VRDHERAVRAPAYVELAVVGADRCRVGDARQRVLGPTDLAELGPGSPFGRSLGNLEALEREAIIRALRDAEANKTRAALALGMSRSTLYRKITHYRIDPDRVVLG